MDPQKVLPHELYTRILERLPGAALMRIRGVCRAWHRCADDQIEARCEKRHELARTHRAQGIYTPVRLQTPEQAPYKVRFSPCSGHIIVHFVCRPPEMFGMLAYAPSQWHDVILDRQCTLGPMVDAASNLLATPLTEGTRAPILSQAIAGRLAAWHSGATPPGALTADGDTLAWLDNGNAYMLDLKDSHSKPVHLAHPDHAYFTGWIEFSPDDSFLTAGSLVLGGCIGAALFDFGALSLY